MTRKELRQLAQDAADGTCRELWEGERYVPDEVLKALDTLDRYEAALEALRDSDGHTGECAIPGECAIHITFSDSEACRCGYAYRFDKYRAALKGGA